MTTVCVALGASCAQAPRQRADAEQAGPCAAIGLTPSRDGFFHEVLFAQPTSRTPRFDDYTQGSYHVNKWELIQGLPDHANRCRVSLQALLVLGPIGPLWSYYVAALVGEGSRVRVNVLVMPHARITGKGTGLVPRRDADAMLGAIRSASLIRAGLPLNREGPDADFEYRLVLALYEPGEPQFFHADFDEFAPEPGLEPLLERVDALLRTARTTTYRHGDAVR